MAFHPQFLVLMPDKVTIEAPTGKNAQGQPSYTGAVAKTYRARITGPVASLRKSNSEENDILYTLWLASGTDTIDVGSRLTLPSKSPWNGAQPLIFSVNYVEDGQTIHSSKVTCGFMYHRQGQT